MTRKRPHSPSGIPSRRRVLRSNDEIAEWLFGLDRQQQLARVTHYEHMCGEIAQQPGTDRRRPYMARMRTLLGVARSNLERGHRADWQMAMIERLGNGLDRLVLEPLARKGLRFPGGSKPGRRNPLGLVLERLYGEAGSLPSKDVLERLAAIAHRDPTGVIVQASMSGIAYRAGRGRTRTITYRTLENRWAEITRKVTVSVKP